MADGGVTRDTKYGPADEADLTAAWVEVRVMVWKNKGLSLGDLLPHKAAIATVARAPPPPLLPGLGGGGGGPPALPVRRDAAPAPPALPRPPVTMPAPPAPPNLPAPPAPRVNPMAAALGGGDGGGGSGRSVSPGSGGHGGEGFKKAAFSSPVAVIAAKAPVARAPPIATARPVKVAAPASEVVLSTTAQAAQRANAAPEGKTEEAKAGGFTAAPAKHRGMTCRASMEKLVANEEFFDADGRPYVDSRAGEMSWDKPSVLQSAEEQEQLSGECVCAPPPDMAWIPAKVRCIRVSLCVCLYVSLCVCVLVCVCVCLCVL